METINWENPYWELREFFRKTEKSPLTLTFGQIEDMIGDTLDWEAYFCEAFWFDEAPGMAGDGWDEEFPFATVADTKVPDVARCEIEEYLKYVVKKYGL